MGRRLERRGPVSSSPMALGELVFANVVDLRVFKAENEQGATAELTNRGGAVPVWFAYNKGLLYLVSRKEPKPEEEKTIPGLDSAEEIELITRRKGRDTSLDRFPASVRLLEGPEFDAAAKI